MCGVLESLLSFCFAVRSFRVLWLFFVFLTVIRNAVWTDLATFHVPPLSGSPPFDGETDDDIEKAIEKGHFYFKGRVWDGISDDAMDFIQELLTYDPEERPTAEQGLAHPWLSNSRKRVNTAYKKRASDSTRSFLNNLKNFNATSKLKQATCSFIASQLLLKQEKEEIDEVFRVLGTKIHLCLTCDLLS